MNQESGIMNQEFKKIRSFTDLDAWKEGHKLVLDIYKVTKEFPEEEKFGIIIQRPNQKIKNHNS